MPVWNSPLPLAPFLLLAVVLGACSASAPDSRGADETYRLALVALAQDPATRIEFEDGLAAKLAASNYDAVPSHNLIPVLEDVSGPNVVSRLARQGIQAVVVMHPAAVGPGASLEAVKNELSPADYADMRAFASRISPTGSEDVVAVVHTAFYMLSGEDSELLSSGAVWLDEPPLSREDGMAKLEDLIVANMNRARPAVRAYLGLPPL